jgi:hypothetical protein
MSYFSLFVGNLGAFFSSHYRFAEGTQMSIKNQLHAADIERIGKVNRTVIWLLDEDQLGFLKSFDKIGRSKLYLTEHVVNVFETSHSPYLRAAAERLKFALTAQ